MKILIALCALLLSGCYTDPGDYVCTDEQSKKLEAEATYCIEKTTYYDSKCYYWAIKRNCVPR